MTKYDLTVVGGGTAGCAAAYIAGKLGLKVLLIEKGGCLGGSMTSGLVIPAMKSSDNQINTEFFDDLILEMKNIGGQISYQNNPGWFNPELLKIALDSMMDKAPVDVRFNTSIISISYTNESSYDMLINSEILSTYNYKLYANNVCKDVDILSEHIETIYLVDATGNAEIFKNLNCNFLENKSEVQPTSLRFIMGGIDLNLFGKWLLDKDNDRNVTSVEVIDGFTHLSTAYTWDTDKHWALAPLFDDAVAKNILKDTDRNYFQVFTIPGMPGSLAFNCPRIVDVDGNLSVNNVSKSLLEARKAIYRLANFCKIYFPGFDNAYISNISDQLGIRTSRRIKGKYIYTMDDILNGKTFEHPVAVANYPIDVHSKTKNKSTLKKLQDYQIPLEACMSDDYPNLFAAGRCISCDYMAQGAIRVQPTCFSIGEGIARWINDKLS